MQIKMTNWMQAMHRSNAKSSGMQISGAKSDAGNGANKKLSGNSASNAASVDLSKSGRYKARMLKESEQCDSADDVMQKAESTIDDIIDTVKSGGKLTREQERIFNDGMRDLASKHYKDMKDMKLSAGDVLQELKENYLQRQQLFADMQKKAESETAHGQELSDNVKLMTAQQEQDEKEKLIEILKESLKEDETDQNQDGDCKTDDDTSKKGYDISSGDTDDNADSINDADAAALQDKLKAADLIDKNSKKISDMKEQSALEGTKERQYARNLEHDYEKIMDILDHDEIAADEKLMEYESYKANSYSNAYNREVYRNKKVFDLETWLTAKIQFNSYDDLEEVKGDGLDLSRIGTDFIKKFMI